MSAIPSSDFKFHRRSAVKYAPKHGLSGPITAHAVDAATRGRRARTDKQHWIGCSIRIPTKSWSKQELRQSIRSATDISANHIRVVYLEIRWSHDISSEDDVPETRSKTLDLALNPFGHINVASVRDVTVRPTGMLPRWRARFIHHALLRNKNERVL